MIRVPLAPSSWSPPPDDWYPFHDIELVESPESPPSGSIIDPKDRASADYVDSDDHRSNGAQQPHNNNNNNNVNNNRDRRDACAVGGAQQQQQQHQQHQPQHQQPEADMIMECAALEPGVGPHHHSHHHHHHHHHHPYLLAESAAAVTTATAAAGHFNVLSFEPYKGGAATGAVSHVGNGGHGTGNSVCHSPAQGNAGTDLNTPVTTSAEVPSFFGTSTVVEPPLITGKLLILY